jgi:hypothetical protein
MRQRLRFGCRSDTKAPPCWAVLSRHTTRVGAFRLATKPPPGPESDLAGGGLTRFLNNQNGWRRGGRVLRGARPAAA